MGSGPANTPSGAAEGRSDRRGPYRALPSRPPTGAVLWEALADAPDVDMAFVYGSLAAGDDRPDSNVDVMVVGEISGRRLASLIREAERTTRRTINEVRYSREEFARRAREAGGFLSRVLDRPRVLLKGDEHALRALAG